MLQPRASFSCTLAVWALAAAGQAQTAESSPAPPAAASIAGRWYSAFGWLDFEQRGHTFSGTYSCCGGTMEGTVVGEQIDFTWKDPIYGEGWGTFKLRDDGTKLVGVWGTMEDFGSRGTWNGSRIEEPAIAGTVSRFQVQVEHPTFGPFAGTAIIGVDGETVTGKLEGSFRAPAKDGLLYRDEIYFPLTGRRAGERLILEWEDPRNLELGGLELDRDGAGWAGEWEAHRTDLRVPMRWLPAE